MQNAEIDNSRIKEMIALVDNHQPLTTEKRLEILKTFQDFECWQPYFRMINENIEQFPKEALPNYIRLTRVYYRYLEDAQTTAQLCARAVSSLQLLFKQFREEFLPQVLYVDDWNTEGLILETVYDKFQGTDDKIHCLERLCLLYEKKIHNETKLQSSYEKLLKIAPKNIKALRYFKLAYTQSADWDEVIAILSLLIETSSHPQEIFRYGQELAAILLYQKDQPKMAIQILEQHCSDSPLDTSTIHFDSYQRLGDWRGCIKVLRQCLLNIEDNWNKAVIHFKIAEIEEQTQNLKNAIDEYAKSAKTSPSFLEPIERMINIYLGQNDWKNVALWMKELESRTRDSLLKQRISEAAQRLQSAMNASA